MSQHSSLRSNSKDVVFRSVLKRFERVKDLKEKEKWDEADSIYGLPKQKIKKFKVKKEKGAAKAADAAAPAAGAAAPAAPAKDAAKGKEAAKGKDSKK